MSPRVFDDRRQAGRVLADQLQHYRGHTDMVVLALPRGGVPVAYEVAVALQAPLDVFVVRKLGAPQHPELAVGAIASGGILVTNDDTIRTYRVTLEDLEQIAETESRELQRREIAYRDDRPPAEITSKTVIVVDDGLATGATMNAALQAIRAQAPARLVIAVPTAPADTCQELTRTADEVICAATPTPFFAVGESYWKFDQTSDTEVRELLAQAATTSAVRQPTDRSDDALTAIRNHSIPAPGGGVSDEMLANLVGDARFVLIGEASHGTHEFYAARAHMTRRLIEEHGFCAVAVEADWPDAYRVNRYVRHTGTDATADAALAGFERFPQWMWRNTVVRDFVQWLREHNSRQQAPVGFFGLDLYSLRRSMTEVINYLDRRDPEAAQRARARYSCFEHVTDEQRYGYTAAFGVGQSCEDEVVAQLAELQQLDLDLVRRDGMAEDDERFYARQNARLVTAAEQYYRTMFTGHTASWNLRDRHMLDTLRELADHLDELHDRARIVVWAHNSHLGDARATELGDAGQLNLGQLVREHYPDQSATIGFTTYIGTVTAADQWDDPARTIEVRPALPGSIEALFHHADRNDFLLSRTANGQSALPASPLLQRAIGVIYRPATERQSHYFLARPADQYDALIHIDTTTALKPLEAIAEPAGEESETYPHAL